ncbi:MAG: hypothetical protein Roseis2KO_07000 [Roseivirga sp.]
MNITGTKSGGTYSILTDRLSRDFLHLCLDLNRMPEIIQDDSEQQVYVLFSGLTYREAQEHKNELMNTGFGNIWIEQALFKKAA